MSGDKLTVVKKDLFERSFVSWGERANRCGALSNHYNMVDGIFNKFSWHPIVKKLNSLKNAVVDGILNEF